ncbi:MAG: branched-chain amino acid ABC transporter substrate-binding protein [Chloroflexota bacterium]|nr:branched-chain amino acid ABC transporter substrate-binding protein [Chloroflexota bacterium]
MKTFRLSAILVVALIALVACQPSGGGASGSPAESAGGSAVASPGGSEAAGDPETVCSQDEFGCAEYAEGDSIRIAMAVSLSGDTSFLGLDSKYGAQVAQQERGDVAGHEVELVDEDAGCGDAATGQTAAQAIVADESIVAAIGTSCSRTAVPAMPVLSEAGVPMISPSNTAPSLTDPNSEDYGGDWYARTAYNDKVQGAAIAQFVCEELDGIETAATIHDGSPYAEQLQQVFADEFQEQCGGTITAQEAINVGDTDMRPVLTTIAADKPDFLFFPIFDPEGPLVTQQAQEVPGLEDTILAGADGIKDDGFIDAAGDVAEEIGMYFSGPDLNFGDKYENEFLPAYNDISGEDGPVAPYHAHAYDAYNIIADGIEAVGIQGDDGTLYVPRTALREYIRGLKDYQGLTGTLTCDEYGDCADPDVSIAQLKDGEFVEVFTTRDQ